MQILDISNCSLYDLKLIKSIPSNMFNNLKLLLRFLLISVLSINFHNPWCQLTFFTKFLLMLQDILSAIPTEVFNMRSTV